MDCPNVKKVFFTKDDLFMDLVSYRKISRKVYKISDVSHFNVHKTRETKPFAHKPNIVNDAVEQ